MTSEKVKLQDVINTLKGYAFKSTHYVPFGVKIVRASNFTVDSIDDNDIKFYSFDEAQLYEKYALNVGDVLIQTVGSWEYNPMSVVGKVVRVPENMEGALLNQNIVKLIPYTCIDNGYLFYRLKCKDFQEHNIGNAVGAANQASITLKTIGDFKFSLPTITIQRRITDILSTYDDLIENNRKQIKLLEEAAQRLYKEWFVDLRFPGWENTKIVDGVPEGWQYQSFSNVFDFVRGKSYTSKELSQTTGVLMATLKNIRSYGGYNRNAEKRFIGQYKKNQMLSAGDVIMGVTDMTQERRLVGHVALVPDIGEQMTFSMDLIKLIPKLTDNLFLYSIIHFGGLSKKIAPLANGVNVLHLKPETMMGMKMLIPSENIMQQYYRFFSKIVKKIDGLQKQSDFVEEARDRLLPKLMNGEIEV